MNKGSRKSISKTVFAEIRARRLIGKRAKDCEFLVPLVRKRFPKSRFKMTHVSWYLSAARWQAAHKRPLDRLHDRRVGA